MNLWSSLFAPAIGGGMLLAIVFAWSVLRAVAILAANRREAVLRLLAVSASEGLPLEASARAFAGSFAGKTRTQLTSLAERLERGDSLSDALAELAGLVSDQARTAARVGEKSGRLAELLSAQVALRSARRGLADSVAQPLGYLMLVFAALEGLAVFLVLSIAPKFRQLYDDFGVELPAISRMAIDLEESPVVSILFLASFLVIAALLLALGAYFVLRLSGAVRPGANLFERLLFRSDGQTMLLESLAAHVDAGLPIHDAVRVLAESCAHRGQRRRLSNAAEALSAGRSPWPLLEESGLLRPAQAHLAAAAERAGNLSWALRALAQRNDQQARRRVEFASRIGAPLVIVGFGLVAVFFAVGFYLPLVHAIQGFGP